MGVFELSAVEQLFPACDAGVIGFIEILSEAIVRAKVEGFVRPQVQFN